MFLNQIARQKVSKLPHGPLMSDEEWSEDKPVLVQFDSEGEPYKVVEVTDEKLNEGEVGGAREEKGETTDEVNKLREDEATERYLKAHKIPYTKEDGIYIVEKYQQVRSRTRHKYKNLMLRKDFVTWKRSKSEMEKIQKRVAEELNKDAGKTDVPLERAKPAGERLLSVTEKIDLGFLLDYVRRTKDVWDEDDEVDDVTVDVAEEDGFPINYESEETERARMIRDAGKEKSFNMKAHRMLSKALLALKAKNNVRNFPRTVAEAMTREDWPLWKEAIRKELMSIVKKGTFRDIQSGRVMKGKPLGTKMVLTIKYNNDGTVERYKARFVVLGNHQVFGESYDETYAPTASMMAVRQFFA